MQNHMKINPIKFTTFEQAVNSFIWQNDARQAPRSQHKPPSAARVCIVVAGGITVSIFKHEQQPVREIARIVNPVIYEILALSLKSGNSDTGSPVNHSRARARWTRTIVGRSLESDPEERLPGRYNGRP